jgi:hypothetical protein
MRLISLRQRRLGKPLRNICVKNDHVSSVFGKPEYAMDIQVVWMGLMKVTIVWVILMHCLLYILYFTSSMIYGISCIRLTVYLLIYVANNKWSFYYMSDCISFILRRLWYRKFHIYGWTYTTYCKSSTWISIAYSGFPNTLDTVCTFYLTLTRTISSWKQAQRYINWRFTLLQYWLLKIVNRPKYKITIISPTQYSQVLRFGHCVVCSSSIYIFWLPIWYLSSNSSTW